MLVCGECDVRRHEASGGATGARDARRGRLLDGSSASALETSRTPLLVACRAECDTVRWQHERHHRGVATRAAGGARGCLHAAIAKAWQRAHAAALLLARFALGPT